MSTGVNEAFLNPSPVRVPVAFSFFTGRLKVSLLQGLECIGQNKEKLISYAVLAGAKSFSDTHREHRISLLEALTAALTRALLAAVSPLSNCVATWVV